MIRKAHVLVAVEYDTERTTLDEVSKKVAGDLAARGEAREAHRKENRGRRPAFRALTACPASTGRVDHEDVVVRAGVRDRGEGAEAQRPVEVAVVASELGVVVRALCDYDTPGATSSLGGVGFEVSGNALIGRLYPAAADQAWAKPAAEVVLCPDVLRGRWGGNTEVRDRMDAMVALGRPGPTPDERLRWPDEADTVAAIRFDLTRVMGEVALAAAARGERLPRAMIRAMCGGPQAVDAYRAAAPALSAFAAGVLADLASSVEPDARRRRRQVRDALAAQLDPDERDRYEEASASIFADIRARVAAAMVAAVGEDEEPSPEEQR